MMSEGIINNTGMSRHTLFTFGFRSISEVPKNASKSSKTSNKGEIFPSRHSQRACKTLASSVFYSRNNAIYKINESTKYIYPDFISKMIDLVIIGSFMTKK